ncbi:MAG: hypothetical protein ACLSVD_00630 [Eggerthellaceae bacterium]
MLAFINEIVHSDKCATEFARMYTNAPFFIDEKDADGNGTGYQLRESYLGDGNEELYAAWDENSDQLIFWSGDWQNAKGVGGPKAFQWLDAEGNIVADAKPALSGSHEINGKTYRTSWDILVEHVTPWTIQRAAEFCELPEGKIKEAIDVHRRQPARVLHARPEGGVLHQHVRHLAGVHHHDGAGRQLRLEGRPEHRPRARHRLRLLHVRRRAEQGRPHGAAPQGNGHEHQEAFRVPEHRLPGHPRGRRRHRRVEDHEAELRRPGHLRPAGRLRRGHDEGHGEGRSVPDLRLLAADVRAHPLHRGRP